MATLGKRVSVPIVPGVMPLEDSTELDTLYFTDSDKIRFQNGKLRKIKGWQRIFSSNFQRITGAARNIFSYMSQTGMPLTIVGTNTRLYVVVQDTFYNITPLQTSTTTIANAFSTEFVQNDFDITTTAGSSTVTLNIPNYFQPFDSIQIFGTDKPVNGIPESAFNGTFSVEAINNTQIEINVGTPATSSGTVSAYFTWAASYLYVNYPNHGLLEGDRIKLASASAVGNILAASINGETVITNVVNPNTFIIQTNTIASSLVTAGGGGSTTIQKPIAAGNIDQNEGYGYGTGNFGVGVYGQQAQTNTPPSYPRIWSMDVFGSNLILTPGDPVSNSTDNLYIWQNNDVTVAPVLVSSIGGASNVPLAVKWVYVSHNAVIALGAAGVLNSFYASDTTSNGYLQWTAGPSTNAFNVTVEQAGPLISQGTSRNRDCLFTENEVYLVEYVNKPFLWNFRKLFTTDGLIGPKARAEVEDAIFWMGQGDFFIFDGTSVNIIPNNTVKRFVFDNVNFSQAHKVVAFANVEYNEVWWFYPAGDDMEPNNYVKYNYKDGVWDIGTLNRSAAEEPLSIHQLPYLIQSVITKTAVIGNNVRTYFFGPANGQIGNNPLTTTSGSQLITINCTADCYLQAGDYIQITGALDTNGIPASEINGIKQIISVTYNNPDASGSSLYGVGLYGVGLYGYAAASGTGLGYGEGGYSSGGYGTGVNTYGYSSGLYGEGPYGVTPIPNSQETQIVIQSSSTNASSSGAGGGNNITVGTNIIGLNSAKYIGVGVNETINLEFTQAIDGFTEADINGFNIPIRFVNGYTLEIQNRNPTTVFSTSLATGGGPLAEITYTPSDRLFMHEFGYDDYNPDYDPATQSADPNAPFLPLKAYAQTNFAQLGDGDQTMILYTLYPDSNENKGMQVTINSRLYAQSPIMTKGPLTIAHDLPKIDITVVARERQYIIENILEETYIDENGNEKTRPVYGSTFLLGKWIEEVKPSSPR